MEKFSAIKIENSTLIYLPVEDIIEEKFFGHHIVSGYAANFEIRARLLFDKCLEKFSTFQSYKHGKLSELLNLFFEFFSNDLDSDKIKILNGCRVLRNSILHCDFDGVKMALSDYFDCELSNVGYGQNISTNSSAVELLDNLNSMSSNEPGQIGFPILSENNPYCLMITLRNPDNIELCNLCFKTGILILDELLYIWCDKYEAQFSYTEDGYWYILRKFFTESTAVDPSNRWKDAYKKIHCLLDNGNLSIKNYMESIGIKADFVV